ncbi:Disease resistance protein RPM1 [Hordeum vulgare]|nr:Disease resistance protein RPM1 [Hordeum vulgare]
MLFDETAEPKALPLSLMAEITNGFSDKHKIGEGGFAVVYQGMLQNGKVAVKRLSNTHMYEKEFHREVECLMMVKHKNVVRFLGYCADTQGSMERYNGKFVMADVQQRLLCFEYLPNGSLDKYITDTSRKVQWRKCFQIIKGICQGLHYLHQRNILHLDLKPANILLDGNLVPKIADFGVSRCFHEMQSRAITVNIRGTLGYLAPEFCNGEITYQLDIYSVGVIIIEILTGKKGYLAVDNVVESWSNKLEKSQSDVQLKQVRICAEIGIECTDFNPAKRPGTKNIIDRLVSLDETDSMGGYIETSAVTSQQAENAPEELHQARPKVPGEISSEDSSFHRSSNLLLGQTQPDGHPGDSEENTHLGRQQKVGMALISNSENVMPEIALLLLTEKIRVALANGAADQAGAHFSKHVTQLKDVQGSMGRVVRELNVMNNVLCQMDIQNCNNQVYEGWLDEVRKIAHAIEDMVDEYLYRVGQEHDIGCCFYLKKGLRKHRSLLSLNQIASNMNKIEKDIADLWEMINHWVAMINNGDISSLNYFDEDDLVGVDKNSEMLEQWLGGDEEVFSVIALVGMGGLGKTALAKNIYRKERHKFQCHAWVSISQTYSREDVLRNIIEELFKNRVSFLSNTAAMDIISLEDVLRTFLEAHKYLIVLDDVWTPEAFDDLSRSLIGNKGSRLIITTREGYVAALASQGHILTLEALPKDKAWHLFCKKSFTRETNHECPEELKALSEEIVSKCKGLPLAIVSVGSLLKDYRFHRKKLVRLWTAEGLIEEKGASTSEEVAEGYLKELVNRKMMQLVERNSFVIELSGMPIESIPDAIGNLFNLRYLGLRGSKVKLLPKSIEKLSNLLTLDLSRSDIHGLCGGIVKLKKLRHLFAEKLIDRSSRALGSLGGVCIPKGLGNLTNLQTLQALDAQDESVRQLGELRQLRSLRIWNTKRTYCERLCESLLQMPYLCNLHVGASDKNEGLMLTAVPANLQKLSLSGRLVEETLLGESPLFQAVEHNLYSLRLSWSQLRQDSLPSLSRLANLTDLYLNRAYNEERMAFLTGWFPKLKHLSLRGMTNLKQLEIEQGAMVTLETLKLGNLNSMMEVPLGLEFLMPLQDLGFFDITCDLLRLLRECRGLTQWHYTLRETTTSDP